MASRKKEDCSQPPYAEIVSPSYIFQYRSASGTLKAKLVRYAELKGLSHDARRLLDDVVIRIPAFCDAFGAYDDATKGDGDVFFGEAH